jgi:hypothetical protein
MGQSGGNRTQVDRELQRTDDEYTPYIQNARGPAGDFGRGESQRLRSEVEDLYRGGSRSRNNLNGANGPGTPGEFVSSNPDMGSFGSSYGGDVGFSNSSLGDTGSARGTYEDFSKTGGVDATALRQRATGVIPGFYQAAKENAARRVNTQGGYGPGLDAQNLEATRAAGRAGFQASRDVEGDIADKVQAGRAQGAAGLMGLGGMETQNNQFNTSGQFAASEGNANRRQSAGQFDASLGLDRDRFTEDTRRYGIEGLRGLYGDDQEQYQRNQENYLRGASGRSGAAQSLVFGRTEPTSRAGAFLRGGAQLGGSLLQNIARAKTGGAGGG